MAIAATVAMNFALRGSTIKPLNEFNRAATRIFAQSSDSSVDAQRI
ncbi:MAG: hypothetical protein ACXWJW_05040 [Xanthobacteraceae bacterium]